MDQVKERSAEIYARITDTIFAVIMGLSFREYYWLLAPPLPSFKLAILIFGYLVVVLSRVGYHKSISLKPYKDSKRFLVDLWILYMYVVLAFAAGGRDSPASVATVVCAQVGVFVGYLLWDSLKKLEYPDSQSSRVLITIICLLIATVILVVFFQPIPVDQDIFLGGSLHDWIFLGFEYAVMVFFWGLKIGR